MRIEIVRCDACRRRLLDVDSKSLGLEGSPDMGHCDFAFQKDGMEAERSMSVIIPNCVSNARRRCGPWWRHGYQSVQANMWV